jgi:hypothetical protein
MVKVDRRLRFLIGLLPLVVVVVMILDGDGTGEMKILLVTPSSSSEYDPESSPPRLLHIFSFDDDDAVSLKRFLDALSFVYDGE